MTGRGTDGTGSPALAAGAQLLAMVSFIAGAAIARHVFPVVGATGATTLRLVGGVVILTVAMRPGRRAWAAAGTRPVILYGLAMGGMNLLFYLAIARVPLGVALALEFTGPLAVAVLSSRSALDLLWLGLAAAGLLLLLPLDGMARGVDAAGGALALGAGAFWALYIVAGRKAGTAHGAATTVVGMTIAAVATAPVGIVQAGAALLRPDMLLLGAGVALLSSALPYTLELFALRRLPARTYGTLTSGEPAIGALLGVALLHEALPPAHGLAIGLIVAAAAGAALTAARTSHGAGRGTARGRGADRVGGVPTPTHAEPPA